ncbi:Hypothetical_protein [Hexamita inflata]|uniref:Hypothetical_protein n=1 Tax=Hexamita inflata TaxID=28002 RepID=A0AA86U8E8_9EUKA|nr:Hypothetical protein HINF_LOCUS32894 [Hexamita inflata]
MRQPMVTRNAAWSRMMASEMPTIMPLVPLNVRTYLNPWYTMKIWLQAAHTLYMMMATVLITFAVVMIEEIGQNMNIGIRMVMEYTIKSSRTMQLMSSMSMHQQMAPKRAGTKNEQTMYIFFQNL